MSPSLITVFPGQGAQKPGMAQDFHDASAIAREIFAEVSDALSVDMAALCFTADPRLDQTENTQPALLTAEIAMFRALQAEHGLQPTRLGGHSLGEYTALVAAGVIPLAEAARLVRARGRLMQQAVPLGQGAMTAITTAGTPLDLAALRAHLEGLVVDLANHNSPEQVVLSGTAADMGVAEARLREAVPDALLTRLAVSAPFHSRLMAPITAEFRDLLRASAPTWAPEGAAQVACNHQGGLYPASREALIEGLSLQIAGAVRWVDNMHALVGGLEAVRVYEIGPRKPLRGFFRPLGIDVVAITSRTSARRALARS